MSARHRGLTVALATLMGLCAESAASGADGGSEVAIPQWVRSAALASRALTSSGEELADVELTADLRLGQRSVRVATGRTDVFGRVQLEHLVPGWYRLTLRHPDFRTRTVALWVHPGHNRLAPQRMRVGQRLQGRVVDTGGNPVAGARMGAVSAGEGALASHRTRSGADGRFVITGLGAGRYRVRAARGGFVTSTQADVVVPLSAPLTIRLAKLGRLLGVLSGGGRRGARVLLSLAGRRIVSQKADEGGRFAFHALAPGVYELQAHSTRKPWRASDVRSVAVRGESEVALSLREGARIFGYVREGGAGGTNKADRPVANATIVLRPDTSSLLQFVERTDDRGWFELPPVAPGDYRLQAWANGLLPVAGVAARAPLNKPVLVTLPRGVVLAGRVADDQGAPMSGVIVRAIATQRVSGESAGKPVGELGIVPGPVPAIPMTEGLVSPTGSIATGFWSAATDDRGVFRLLGLPNSGFGLLLSHPEHGSVSIDRVVLPEVRRATLEPPEAVTCRKARPLSSWVRASRDSFCRALATSAERTFTLGTVMMPAVSALLVRVLDARGFVLPGAKVVLAQGSRTRQAYTDVHGMAALRHTGDGAANLLAEADGFQPARMRAMLKPGSRRLVEVVLSESAGELSGTVATADGEPLAGAQVEVVGAVRPLGSQSARDGTFRLRGLAPGVVRIRVRHAGYVPAEQLGQPGDVLRIALRRQGSLEGRVVEWRTGHVIRSFVLQVDDGSTQPLDHRDGLFRLSAPPGVHRLRVGAQGFAELERQVTVPAADNADLSAAIEVQLRRAGRVTGRVIDNRGEPVIGAKVSCSRQSAATGAHGSFELQNVAEGKHELIVEARPGTPQRWQIVVHDGSAATPFIFQLRGSSGALAE